MKDRETKVQPLVRQADHKPRPVKPEDASYGELMMHFTAHPVKPKYWFEEFGDHWTCSCGQINKGDTCANCGLERDLLRQLFILHKPSADGTPAGNDGQTGTPSSNGPGDAEDKNDSGASNKANRSDDSRTSQPLVTVPDPDDDEDARPKAGSSHTGLIAGILIACVLLLLGTGAFVYFVLIPQMQEQTAAKRDSVRISLSEHLPVATAPIPKAQRKAYIAAGDMLCDNDKYQKSLTYYNKAADLKDDDSIKQKILDAKFGYVKAHQSEGDGYFETYLNELVEARYDGARAIYDSYYAWHVNIVANNLKDDFSTDMENVNKADTVYFHTTVTGGAPGDAVRLYYQIIWPDGTAETKDVDSTWSAGSHFTSRFQYPIPLLGQEGKLTFELYDKDSHDLLGKDTVNLKK